MATFKKLTDAECGFVEVLTTRKTGIVYGYRLVGAKPGPQLAVAGMCPSAVEVFNRLQAIPTLPWMRGNLVLIRLDALDHMLGDLSALSPLGEIDRTIVLPWSEKGDHDDAVVRRSYHMVLRACADLGMISGRGIGRSA